MRALHKAGLVVCGLFLLAAGAAHAGDQNICAKVSLSGFNNKDIVAGYVVTDLFARFHECSPKSSSSCSACAGAKSYPKNVGNILCLRNLKYSVSSSCQNLLNQGSGNCEKNIAPVERCGQSAVMPVCNWRTNNNSNEADWNWSLTMNGSTVVVDCSQNNFLGPEN